MIRCDFFDCTRTATVEADAPGREYRPMCQEHGDDWVREGRATLRPLPAPAPAEDPCPIGSRWQNGDEVIVATDETSGLQRRFTVAGMGFVRWYEDRYVREHCTRLPDAPEAPTCTCPLDLGTAACHAERHTKAGRAAPEAPKAAAVCGRCDFSITGADCTCPKPVPPPPPVSVKCGETWRAGGKLFRCDRGAGHARGWCEDKSGGVYEVASPPPPAPVYGYCNMCGAKQNSSIHSCRPPAPAQRGCTGCEAQRQGFMGVRHTCAPATTPAPAPYRCPNERPWCQAEKRCGVCESTGGLRAGEYIGSIHGYPDWWAKEQHGISPDLPPARPNTARASFEGLGGCGIWKVR